MTYRNDIHFGMIQGVCLFLGNYTCPELYAKCPGSYCIPLHKICNGIWDCPAQEDEQNCGRLQICCYNYMKIFGDTLFNKYELVRYVVGGCYV